MKGEKKKRWYHDGFDYRHEGELNIAYENIMLVFLIVVCVPLLIIGTIYTTGYLTPIRAEAALTECRDLGYESYHSYTTKPFGIELYGLRCENPSQRIDIRGAVPVEVIK